jgi:hypothetical protein
MPSNVVKNKLKLSGFHDVAMSTFGERVASIYLTETKKAYHKLTPKGA